MKKLLIPTMVLRIFTLILISLALSPFAHSEELATPGSTVILIFVVLIVVIGGLFVFYIARNVHTDDSNSFSQAGVRVSYAEKTIEIKSNTYPVSAIRGLRWESGRGQKGNQSRAIISVDDMRKPVHSLDFITPGAAEAFVQRLSLAIEKAGGSTFS